MNDLKKTKTSTLDQENLKSFSEMTLQKNNVKTISVTSQDYLLWSTPSTANEPTNYSKILSEDNTVKNSERLLEGNLFGEQTTTAPRNQTGTVSS